MRRGCVSETHCEYGNRQYGRIALMEKQRIAYKLGKFVCLLENKISQRSKNEKIKIGIHWEIPVIQLAWEGDREGRQGRQRREDRGGREGRDGREGSEGRGSSGQGRLREQRRKGAITSITSVLLCTWLSALYRFIKIIRSNSRTMPLVYIQISR